MGWKKSGQGIYNMGYKRLKRPLKEDEKGCLEDTKKNSFPQRKVEAWNGLEKNVVHVDNS